MPAVWAARDPGLPPGPDEQLQRVQIVKAWLENGTPREKVFEVAGDPQNGAGVDLDTCTPHGPASSELCTVWSDPEFDPGLMLSLDDFDTNGFDSMVDVSKARIGEIVFGVNPVPALGKPRKRETALFAAFRLDLPARSP